MRRLFVLISILLSVSCANIPGDPLPAKEVPPLAKVPGRGVTFTIPNEDGWFLFNPDGRGATIMKSGETKVESYAISLDFYRVPIPETDSEFKKAYENLKKIAISPPRYKSLATEESFNSDNNRFEMNFYYLVEDHQAEKNPPGDKYMLLQAMGILAEHPSIPDYIVRITYSHRYAIGNEDLNFKEKAKWVMENAAYINQ